MLILSDRYRLEYTSFRRHKQRKSRRLLVFQAVTKHLTRHEGAQGVPSPVYRLCWVFPAIAPTVVNLQLLPCWHSCQRNVWDAAYLLHHSSRWDRHYVARHKRRGRKKGHFLLHQRTEKSLVSCIKLPQEKGPRTRVVEHPWDSASSLHSSAWISDQRYWAWREVATT